MIRYHVIWADAVPSFIESSAPITRGDVIVAPGGKIYDVTAVRHVVLEIQPVGRAAVSNPTVMAYPH